MDCIHTHQGILGQGWRVLAKSGQSKAILFCMGLSIYDVTFGGGWSKPKNGQKRWVGGFSKPKVVLFMDSP